MVSSSGSLIASNQRRDAAERDTRVESIDRRPREKIIFFAEFGD